MIFKLIGLLFIAVIIWLVDRETFEQRYEFDLFNLRTRYCESSLFRERCSEPIDHPTAKRLRELGVLPPVSEEDAQWELNSGFKHRKLLEIVRGWRGPGRDYIRALGPTTWLTPVPFPGEEDLSQNPWVRWALQEPDDVRAFWHEQREIAAADPNYAATRLMFAGDWLQQTWEPLTLENVNAEITSRFLEYGMSSTSPKSSE